MKKNQGFTLIELLIVIAIIGILVAIVLPSYQAHIQKSNRVAAQLTLTKMAQEFERTSARQGVYPVSSSSSTATYNYTADTTDTTFTITATPKGSDECGVLTITQTGETTSSSSSDCW